MPELIGVDESLVSKLPTPLAKLVRRAHNAKTPLDRHQAAYYLWEAALKLLGSVAVVEYAALDVHDPELVKMLKILARPALGHWWEFVRRLVPVLADMGDDEFSRVRDLVLGPTCDNMPRAAGLDIALIECQKGKASARPTVRLTDLFSRLVWYRNSELGHGAAGLRPGRFYDRMGRALLDGVVDVLGALDTLAGRRLILVSDVRQLSSGEWLVERYELVGESPRRIESLEVAQGHETSLPRHDRVYIEKIGHKPPVRHSDRLCLSPLIHFELESERVFFLNARHGRQQVKYLCFHDGEQLRRELDTGHSELLSRVLQMDVDAKNLEDWAAQSQAEGPASGEPIVSAHAERMIGGFELLSRLGQGGMGVVYRAWQPSLGRQVALKCMLKSGDPKAEARFTREIHALGRVDHPGVVKIFTSGSEADQWFFAMELVEGTDLARACEYLSGRKVTELDGNTWHGAIRSAYEAARSTEVPLNDSKQTGERLARVWAATEEADDDGRNATTSAVRGVGYISEVVEIIRQVAEAADALHEVGIVHRDIKPGNIMLGRDGKDPVLMDLGLAQLADEAQGRLTRTRQFVGTLRYASPEQVQAATPVDRRSDVYGLGATLWELLALRPLFGATDETPTPELMQTIMLSEPGSPRKQNPNVPRDLEAIVLKCLEKDKTRRYATARELAADLSRFLRNEPVTARLSSPAELTIKWMRRRPAIAALSSTVLLVTVLGVAGVLWQWRTTVQERDVARQNAYFAIMHLAEREWNAEQYPRLTEILESARPKRNETDLRGYEWYYLHRQCHTESMTLEGHNGAVRAVAFSPDGHTVTSVGSDRTLKKWDARSGRQLLTSKIFSERDYFLALGPDAQTIVLQGPRGVIVFDATSPQTPVLMQDQGFGPGLAAYSRDGKYIAFSGPGSDDLSFWDIEKRQKHPIVHAHSLDGSPVRSGPYSRVLNTALSPDGLRIATVALGGRVNVCDVRSGAVALAFMVTSMEDSSARSLMGVPKIAFNADGNRLASVSTFGTVKLYDAVSGKELLRLKGRLVGLAFSADGQLFASAGGDGTVSVGYAESGQELSVLRGHTGSIEDLVFSPDGSTIASAGTDGTIKLWQAPSRAKPKTFRVLPGARLDRDRSRVGGVNTDGTVNVWDARSGEPLFKQKLGIAEPETVRTVRTGPEGLSRIAISSDFRYAAVAEQSDGSIAVCDTRSGKRVFTLTNQFSGLCRPTFSPDGRRILANAADGKSQLLDVESGHVVCAIDGVVEQYAPLFSPDGRYLAVCTEDTAISLWDLDSGLRSLAIAYGGSSTYLLPLLLSSDGRRLVVSYRRIDSDSGNSMGVAYEYKVLDARSGHVLASLEGLGRRTLQQVGHEVPPLLIFSPDNRRLFHLGRDGLVKVWDAESGRRLLELKGHLGAVHDLAFSRDGRRIISAGADQTIRVWDFETGQEVLTLRGHTHPVLQISLSPDDRCLTSIGADGTVMVWDSGYK